MTIYDFKFPIKLINSINMYNTSCGQPKAHLNAGNYLYHTNKVKTFTFLLTENNFLESN